LIIYFFFNLPFSKINSLPNDISFEYALSLPIDSLVSNSEYNKFLCENAKFWELKTVKDFGISTTQFYIININPMDRYLQLLASYGKKCVKGSEHSVDIDTCLLLANNEGNVDLVDYFLVKGPNNLNRIITKAAKSGNLEIFRDLINQNMPAPVLYQILNYAVLHNDLLTIDRVLEFGITPTLDSLNNAALTGNLELLKYLLSKTKMSSYMLNIVINKAGLGGHKQIIDYIISQIGLSNVNLVSLASEASNGNHLQLFNYLFELQSEYDSSKLTNLVERAIIGAARGGHFDLFKYLLSLNYYYPTIKDLNWMSSAAVSQENVEFVKYLLSLGATNLNNTLNRPNLISYLTENESTLQKEYPMIKLPNEQVLHSTLVRHVKTGNIKMVDYLLTHGIIEKLISKGFRGHLNILDGLLESAARGGKLEMVLYLLSKGSDINNTYALREALIRDKFNVFYYLLTIDKVPLHLEAALETAAGKNYLKLVKYLISLGTFSTKALNKALDSAAHFNNLDVTEYLLSIGANDLNTALISAARECSNNVMNYLISRGASNTAEAEAVHGKRIWG